MIPPAWAVANTASVTATTTEESSIVGKSLILSVPNELEMFASLVAVTLSWNTIEVPGLFTFITRCPRLQVLALKASRFERSEMLPHMDLVETVLHDLRELSLVCEEETSPWNDLFLLLFSNYLIQIYLLASKQTVRTLLSELLYYNYIVTTSGILSPTIPTNYKELKSIGLFMIENCMLSKWPFLNGDTEPNR